MSRVRRPPRWILPFLFGVAVSLAAILALVVWQLSLLANLQTRLIDQQITSHVFEAQPGPDIPTLQELAAGIGDDVGSWGM
jgi:cytochrome oxidase assembly protein ShyY1